jgi:hypothetical protein
MGRLVCRGLLVFCRGKRGWEWRGSSVREEDGEMDLR